MEDKKSFKQAVSNMSSNTSTAGRPHLSTAMEIGENISVKSVKKENRAPPPLPIGLNSMLKTTTERGDIGLFAIKPPRIPQTSKLPRTNAGNYDNDSSHPSQQRLQLETVSPIFDDRRRLPSYARDATSEIVSMYQSTSQKSSINRQFSKEPDYRSYSMTQASYAPYSLSNNRSYTSLRSQPEVNLIPRPRSPFPYPVRLKRLGFRPLSPSITDGGNFDYVQHGEIERTPNGPSENAPPSTSLNSHKRTPTPFIVRSNLNRSNPSLLGQPSPSQRPNVTPRNSSVGSLQDWSNRVENGSRKKSPARGISSLDIPSGVPHNRQINHTTTTPGKHAPSPLYYDYTEEFNAEEAYHGGVLPRARMPPPTFLGNKTIHEDRELSSKSSYLDISFMRGPAIDLNLSGHPPSPSKDVHYSPNKTTTNDQDDNMERSTNVTQDIIPLYLDRRSYEKPVPPMNNEAAFPQIHGLSNVASRILPSEDVPNPIAPVVLHSVAEVETDKAEAKASDLVENYENSDQNDGTDAGSLFDRRSSFRLSAFLPSFPNPPNRPVHVYTDFVGVARSQRGLIVHADEITPVGEPNDHIPTFAIASEALDVQHQPIHIGRHPVLASAEVRQGLSKIVRNLPPTSPKKPTSLGRSYSVDHGFLQLAEPVSNFEAIKQSLRYGFNASSSSGNTTRPSTKPLPVISPTSVMSAFPTPPNVGAIQGHLLEESRTMLNKYRSESNLRDQKARPIRMIRPQNLEDPAALIDANGIFASSRFNHRLAEDSFLRSYSPMLAPQPVSPARVLKLKNSIPQLMKALPPVPRETIYAVVLDQTATLPNLPSKIAHFRPEPVPEHTSISATKSRQPYNPSDKSGLEQQKSDRNNDIQPKPKPVPKFKLKSKLLGIQRPLSPPVSRLWSEEENFPSSREQSTTFLSPMLQNKPENQRPPKFKMRIIRSSDDSSGTVRINPNATGHLAMSSLDLRYPKDLFTSAPGLTELFRQVGRQFSSRKTSSSAHSDSTVDIRAPARVLTSPQVDQAPGKHRDSGIPLGTPIMPYPISPTEVRSFFSDSSSQVHSHNSLRKRISNLRARIPNPYTARHIPHSHEDMTWRDRIEATTPTNDQSGLNYSSTQDLDEYGMPLATFPQKRLRSKVSMWFREARMAISRHGKIRNSDEIQCLPLHR